MQNEMTASIEAFEYPLSGLALPTPGWELAENSTAADCAQPFQLSNLPDSQGKEHQPSSPTADAPSEEHSRVFEEGRAQGYSEGRCAERAELASRVQEIEVERIEQAVRLNEQFERERERYVHSIECEVAQLALSIASRILRREMQIDPLLLTGAVRVALGQVSDKTSVRLRVPAEHADLWSETMEHLPNVRVKLAIVADKQLQPGECFLETKMGSADVGVRSQLSEIARNLFDAAGVITEQNVAAGEDESAVQG
jgi:flagellar biosynthesis/type III secretory pathway protein FliH